MSSSAAPQELATQHAAALMGRYSQLLCCWSLCTGCTKPPTPINGASKIAICWVRARAPGALQTRRARSAMNFGGVNASWTRFTVLALRVARSVFSSDLRLIKAVC
jgi:hypothetical protein